MMVQNSRLEIPNHNRKNTEQTEISWSAYYRSSWTEAQVFTEKTVLNFVDAMFGPGLDRELLRLLGIRGRPRG